jgi:threonine synthase
MKYVSTKGFSEAVSFKEAVLSSVATDGGLYVPASFPPVSFKPDSGVQEIGQTVLSPFVAPDISAEGLAGIVEKAFTFDAPLIRLEDDLYVLELFHGPTAAFKDFGVRFMARVIEQFAEGQEVTILTATSGDTGGAVAAAFHGVPNVKAIILYPKNKVTPIQEMQIAGLGQNIIALEVDGNFDDCQRMVRAAFADLELRKKHSLLSANSINIARLLPQICYYFRAYAQLPESAKPTFVVPSGNFGNLTAGLYARQMGLPAAGFVAVTNANDVVPRYLKSGEYKVGAFVETLTNAMDIADPSNFTRIEALFGFNLDKLRSVVSARRFTDEQMLDGMKRLYEDFGYVADPHTAQGFLGTEQLAGVKVLVSTAHPRKFPETVERVTKNIPSIKSLDFGNKPLYKMSIPTRADLKEVLGHL